jgi:MFS family permease
MKFSNQLGDPLLLSEDTEPPKTYWVAFLITFPVFMGYACCFSLQKNLSYEFGLTEGVSGNTATKLYGLATSFVYFFNLLFRIFGHNIVFACLSPRHRILCALTSNIIGMTLLSYICFQPTPPAHSVAWVFFSYAFVGISEGSFGPNMLNVVNHLGETRVWMIMGMPAGVATITILGFGLMAGGMPFQYLYILTAVISALAIIVYLFTIYPVAKSADMMGDSFDLKKFWWDLREIRQWFPKIWLYSLVFIVNMTCLSMFNPGCTLYSYQTRVTYRLFGFTLSHDWFMMLYNIGSFFGDFVSRRVMNRKALVNPFFYFLLLCVALALNLSLIPEIAPFAAFGFSWANGALYCQSTKLIGRLFTTQYHLTATSTWLFLGDVGSTVGANLVQPVRPAITVMKAEMC